VLVLYTLLPLAQYLCSLVRTGRDVSKRIAVLVKLESPIIGQSMCCSRTRLPIIVLSLGEKELGSGEHQYAPTCTSLPCCGASLLSPSLHMRWKNDLL